MKLTEIKDSVHNFDGYVREFEAVLQQKEKDKEILSFSLNIFESQKSFGYRIDFEVAGRKIYKSDNIYFSEIRNSIVEGKFKHPKIKIEEGIKDRTKGELAEVKTYTILKRKEGQEIVPGILLLRVSRATKAEDNEGKTDLVLMLQVNHLSLVFTNGGVTTLHQMYLNVKSSYPEMMKHKGKHPSVPSIATRMYDDPIKELKSEADIITAVQKICLAIVRYELGTTLGQFLGDNLFGSDTRLARGFKKLFNIFLERQKTIFHQDTPIL